MFKKTSMLVFSFIFFLGFLNSTVNAETINNTTETGKYKEELTDLTEEEVNERFSEIDKNYDLGEEFSKKDQAFIEMYAKPVNSSGIELFKSKKVSSSRTVNGITVKVNGTINANVNGIINQSFGASNLKTRTTAGSSKVNSVKTKVHHNAYGLVGSNGVGKVYTGSISASGKNNTINSTKKYTANVVYASTWVEATVKYKGGTFTVN